MPNSLESNKPSVETLLPEPFAWSKVSAGNVKLLKSNYGGHRSGVKPTEGEVFNLPAFSISKYPVTNAQFAKFLDSGGYMQQSNWTEAGWQLREQNQWTQPKYWHTEYRNQRELPNHPVSLTWFEAEAFCIWLSDVTGEKLTLPTEQQWQRAAQGDDEREYPWGNTLDSTRCSTAESLAPVTKFEGKGDSPFGVVDMVGNGWEWCLTGSRDSRIDANFRVLRGGFNDYNGGSWFGCNVHYSTASDPKTVQGGSFRLVRL